MILSLQFPPPSVQIRMVEILSTCPNLDAFPISGRQKRRIFSHPLPTRLTINREFLLNTSRRCSKRIRFRGPQSNRQRSQKTINAPHRIKMAFLKLLFPLSDSEIARPFKKLYHVRPYPLSIQWDNFSRNKQRRFSSCNPALAAETLDKKGWKPV